MSLEKRVVLGIVFSVVVVIVLGFCLREARRAHDTQAPEVPALETAAKTVTILNPLLVSEEGVRPAAKEGVEMAVNRFNYHKEARWGEIVFAVENRWGHKCVIFIDKMFDGTLDCVWVEDETSGVRLIHADDESWADWKNKFVEVRQWAASHE